MEPTDTIGGVLVSGPVNEVTGRRGVSPLPGPVQGPRLVTPFTDRPSGSGSPQTETVSRVESGAGALKVTGGSTLSGSVAPRSFALPRP